MERLTTRHNGLNEIKDFLDVSCRDICEEHLCEICPIQNVIDKLAEYEDLEEQGLLIRLPCKVGDIVYTKCSWGIEKGVVGSIEIIADRIFVNNIHGGMIGEINNIFLTREEAEAALERTSGK